MKTTREAKKPTVARKIVKRVKLIPKELTFTQKIAKISWKNIIVLSALAALLVIAVSVLPGTIASNSTNQQSVLEVSDLKAPTNISVTFTKTTITLTWNTNLQKNGADWFKVYFDKSSISQNTSTPSTGLLDAPRSGQMKKFDGSPMTSYSCTKSKVRWYSTTLNHKVTFTGGLSGGVSYRFNLLAVKSKKGHSNDYINTGSRYIFLK